MNDHIAQPATEWDYRKRYLKTVFCVGMLLLLGTGARLMGQNRNAGEIRGTVEDSSGGVVPAVLVDATNIATGQVTHGTTNVDGIYDLPFVPTGAYSVTFTRNGYEKSVQNNIVLHVETL